MLAQALYNVVDRVFVGRAVGTLGIAGATVSFPFMLIMMACAMLVGFGATTLVSIQLGKKRHADAERILGNAFTLLLLTGLALTIAGSVWLDRLLVTFGATRQILPYAHDYLRIIVFGSIAQTVGFGLNSVIRGEGNPRAAMITMLIGASLNTILDPIFLFYCGWGMRGAALSTVISQAVASLWVLSYFFGGRSLLKIRPGNLRLNSAICRRILAFGSPIFAMQVAGSMTHAILNNQLRIHGGELAISAMGIIYAVVMFVAMPIFGITQGAQPIIGFNHGAGNRERVRRTLLAAIACASAVCLAGFTLVMVFPERVIELFNRQPQLVNMGVHAIRVSLVMLPIIGFQIVCSNYFQAVGKPGWAMLLGLSRQVLLLLPAILILPRWFGLDGIWAAFPTADLCAFLLTGVCFAVDWKRR